MATRSDLDTGIGKNSALVFGQRRLVAGVAKQIRRGQSARGRCMTVLVFGKTGQVARELAQYSYVRCLDRADADLSQPLHCGNMIRRLQPEVVINAAAFTGVDEAEQDEALATVINGDAPAAMAVACAEMAVPFVHISTDYVFDGTGSTAFAPDHETCPLGAYGRSKQVGERGVVAAGGKYAILRTSWVYSRHGKNFLKTMLRLSETRDQLGIVNDQIGGPTPAAAIAAACVVATPEGLAAAANGGEGRPKMPFPAWAQGSAFPDNLRLLPEYQGPPEKT